MSRFILPVLTFLAFVAIPCAIRADDELNRIRGLGKVAAEKLTQEVVDALAASRKLEKDDPSEAKALLNKMLGRVTDSDVLGATQRADLIRRLNTGLKYANEAVTRRQNAENQKMYSERPKSRPTNDPPAGGGVSGLAKEVMGSAATASKIHQDNIKLRETNITKIGAQRDNVVIPDESGIAFPKNWAAISAAAKKRTGPQLTAKEVALLKALNSVMSVNYDGDKFRSVIDHIQDKTGLSIIVDEASMQDAKVEYDDPITFKINKVPVRTILKKVLGDKGLAYVIKEGTIQVMTPKKASEMLVTRSYPVEDLIMPAGPPTYFQSYQMRINANQLIGLIQSATDASYWQPNGPGSITYYEPTRSLVVRASSEMHYQLGSPSIFGR